MYWAYLSIGACHGQSSGFSLEVFGVKDNECLELKYPERKTFSEKMRGTREGI